MFLFLFLVTYESFTPVKNEFEYLESDDQNSIADIELTTRHQDTITVHNKTTQNKNKPKRIVKVKPSRTLQLQYTNLLLDNIKLRDPLNFWIRCEMCDYRTQGRDNIRTHMNAYHLEHSVGKNRPKKFTCEICGSRLTELANLRQHMTNVHSNIKPFVCTFESCTSRFPSNSLRNAHLRGHLAEKTYKCGLCPQMFKTKHTMVVHQRVHSDERPFACNQCEQTFKTKSVWKQHELTHTEIRPYQCQICDKQIQRLSAFNVHMNTHTDNRPYKCSLCDRGFHSSSARRSHEKTVHNKP